MVLFPTTPMKESWKTILEARVFVLPISGSSEVIFILFLDDQGESKCVAFGLCLDSESVKKALRLDGERFGTKTLRINRAAK